VFIIDVVYFVIDSVRKLLDTPSYKGAAEKRAIIKTVMVFIIFQTTIINLNTVFR